MDGSPHWAIDPLKFKQFFVDFKDTLTKVIASHPSFKLGEDHEGKPLTPEKMIRKVDGAIQRCESGRASTINNIKYLEPYLILTAQMHAVQIRDCLGEKLPVFISRSEILASEYDKRLVRHPGYPKH